MADHFQAIGVNDWRAFAEHAFGHGEWEPLGDGGRTGRRETRRGIHDLVLRVHPDDE